MSWQVWALGALCAFAVAALGAIGEQLGWWHVFGEALMWAGTIVGLVLSFNSATEHSMARVREDLGGMADELATIRVVLERMLALLDARLPRER